MLSGEQYIKQSLETHLFFGRIMKEHSFFLEVGFTPKDSNYTQQADAFRNEFDGLLTESIYLSNGVVGPEVIASGEIVTQYTLNAELLSSYFTGVQLQTSLTKAEAGLAGSSQLVVNPVLEQRVSMLNQRAITLIAGLIQFKANVLSNVLSCKMFTVNYPLLLDHMLREAKLYHQMIHGLQKKEEVDIKKFAYDQELFWNRIMAEHSKFIRGLLDPSENDLITTANNFGNQFDKLAAEVKAAMDKSLPIAKVTADSRKATKEVRDFNAAGTKGLLECKIKSIIIPLLGDHVLRESNHFLRLLSIFS